MADKLNIIQDLDNDDPFQVYVRVLQVQQEEDKKGDPYHSMKVKDDTGTAWLKAWKSHNLSVRPGDLVKGKAKVNVFKGKKSLSAWGDDLTVIEGSEAPQDTFSPDQGPRPSSGGSAPYGAEKAVQRQDAGQPLAEYQRWWLARWEWYRNSPPIQEAVSRGEDVAVAIRDAIGAEWMSQSPYERNIERTPYPGVAKAAQAPPEPPQSDDDYPGRFDDDDLPF